jgi:hypothetical protein
MAVFAGSDSTTTIFMKLGTQYRSMPEAATYPRATAIALIA